MKVVIPINDRGELEVHFGRASKFLILEVVDLSSIKGLACSERISRIIDTLKDCDMLICKSIGGKMLEYITNAGVKVVSCDEDELCELICKLITDNFQPREVTACAGRGRQTSTE